MSSQKAYSHWRTVLDEEDILWLYLDKKGTSVNTLSQPVLVELDHILTDAKNEKLRGIVLASAKKTGFIAGADVNEFTTFKNAEEALTLIRLGQEVCANIASFSVPTVALIHGFCLGGGLELALACRYRVASDSPDTKFALPEVMLGIHPGWGGTVRLFSYVGTQQALDMLVTGRTISAKKAQKMGLVSYVIPEGYLSVAAHDMIIQPPKLSKPPLLSRIVNSSLARAWFANVVRNRLKKKVNPKHYPAPFAVVDLWEKHGQSETALQAETESIGKLLQHATAKNLIRVYFLKEQLKDFGKTISFPVRNVHVIGAGVMGGDIAAWCALSGLTVTLEDISHDKIAQSLTRAVKLFTKKLDNPRKIQAALDRFTPDTSGFGIRRADIIIEAVVEDLVVKKTLWKKIDTHARPGSILATNTSSFSISEIASVLKKPDRLIGIHFFNPVALMPLIEVVRAPNSDEACFNKALAFVQLLGKLPLPVADSPGFLVNRVLFPYLLEAFRLLMEGMPKAAIDKAAEDFGMPMGPIELADTVGLDVCYSVAKNLLKHDELANLETLSNLINTGKLGKKTEAGFYTYKNGEAQKEAVPTNFAQSEQITQRLVLILINEAARCMQDKIVTEPNLVDAGMIFGAGFAPYLGGPLHYAQTVGIEKIVADLKALASQYGERFTPSEWWQRAKDH